MRKLRMGNELDVERSRGPGGQDPQYLQALERQLRELRAFVETASIGMHRVGPDGTILWANATELKLLGYTPEEYVGHNIAEFHADSEVTNTMLQCLGRGERLCEYEARLKAKDGSIKHVLIDSSVLFENGKFIHTQCFTRDITQRKATEDELRRAAFILNHSGWAVATIESASDRIDFCNAAFAQMHGYASHQMIGMPFVETFAPEWLPNWPQHRLGVTRGGDYIYESTHVRKDGSRFEVRTHATTFQKDGQPIFRASIFEDITQRKRTEEALRKSEAFKTGILNSSLDAAITMDSEEKIIEFNPAAEKIFGYSREQALGQRMDQLIVPPSLREAHARGMARYLSTGEARILGRRIEITAMRSDGSEFPCELTVSRVPIDGPPIFTASVRDITERNQTLSALAGAKQALEEHAGALEKTVAERTAALQSTIAELERFSYSLSHDMRAPLRAIHSFVQIVLADAGEKLGPSEKEYLQKAIRAAGRLDRLIQDVLSYSRVTREAITLRDVNVERLIRQIIDERPEFRPPTSNVIIEGPIAPVLGHEAYLTQCITNLLDNAVKFVEPGRRPEIRISSKTTNGHVQICFSDNGIGIPKEAQDRVFGMFQRLHGDDAFSGTGIGLTIVRKAVERMGGQVGVESKPGVGSKFWLKLRLASRNDKR